MEKEGDFHACAISRVDRDVISEQQGMEIEWLE